MVAKSAVSVCTTWGSACPKESSRAAMPPTVTNIRWPPEPQKASDELSKEPGPLQSTELPMVQPRFFQPVSVMTLPSKLQM